MSVPLAHIAGIPLEEGLPTITPAACALVILVRARVRGMGGWRRRR